MNTPQRTLFELYAEDPLRADEQVFGRRSYPDRRGFLKGAGLATMAALLGGAIPFHRNLPAGLIPVALAEQALQLDGKDGLILLSDRPLNAECRADLLDDEVTPTARHFIRNNGNPPLQSDAGRWMLEIDGEVERPLKLGIADLRRNFEVVKLRLQLECGGNGRAFFDPKARGNQWTLGAVACSEWTGVRLADLLKAAGLKPGAVYTAHYGADTHLSGDEEKEPLSRGVPIAKALSPYNLVAFEQNGAPLHPMNGAPLRLVVPGWPGSCSQKWLTRIRIRDGVHDGAKMTGTSYRVPEFPVAPGEKVPAEALRIIESMPVKSLITAPASGVQVAAARPELEVRGHAWAGDDSVRVVELSIDFGASWTPAELRAPANPYAWQRFRARLRFPTKGYYEVWARATDDRGRMQPFVSPWNPGGYVNNQIHRIAVRVA